MEDFRLVRSDVVPLEPLVGWGHFGQSAWEKGMVGVVLIEPMIA